MFLTCDRNRLIYKILAILEWFPSNRPLLKTFCIPKNGVWNSQFLPNFFYKNWPKIELYDGVLDGRTYHIPAEVYWCSCLSAWKSWNSYPSDNFRLHKLGGKSLEAPEVVFGKVMSKPLKLPMMSHTQPMIDASFQSACLRSPDTVLWKIRIRISY